MTSTALTTSQRLSIKHAQRLAAIPSGDATAIGAYIGHGDMDSIYAAAYGNAKATLRELLEIIDGLTGGTS